MRRPLLLLLVCLLSLTSGCSHVISRQARSAVDEQLTLAAIKAAPADQVGKTMLLGGAIVACRPAMEHSTLEIFHWKLDGWGEPLEVDEAGGRFLVVADRFLDPALYDVGRLVTLAATFKGMELHPLGEVEYNYPLFQAVEIHLWDTPLRYGLHRYPNLYTPTYVPPWYERPNPYDPGYGPYPYTPFWLRPWWYY